MRTGTKMTDTLEIAVTAVRLYAESHPRPSHVNQQQACELLGKSAPTVRKMIRAGEIRTNAIGLIPMWEIDRLLAPKMPHDSAKAA